MISMDLKWRYLFEDRDFHCSLVKVGGFILDDFHSDDFHRLHILTFDDLGKRSLSKDIKNKISTISHIEQALYLCP